MHSRLQPWLEWYVENSSIPLINWEVVTADLKSCGGKINLMQRWMAGHTATKALSHSHEAYLITVLQRAIRLCLSLSFADICASPRSVSLPSLRDKPHSQTACCYAIARRSVQKCSIISLSGLFQNISDLRQGCHWWWTEKNWGEMMMGTNLYGGWQDWVIDNSKAVNTTHSRLGWDKKVEARQD